MTIRKAMTYDDGWHKPWVYEDYDFSSVADFIRDELECGNDCEGEDVESVAEDMANGDRDIPDWLGERLNDFFAKQAYAWKDRALDEHYLDL